MARAGGSALRDGCRREPVRGPSRHRPSKPQVATRVTPGHRHGRGEMGRRAGSARCGGLRGAARRCLPHRPSAMSRSSSSLTRRESDSERLLRQPRACRSGTCERASAGRWGRREPSGSARRPHQRGRRARVSESGPADPRGVSGDPHRAGRALERLDLPIGVVSAIAGNTRAELRFDGESGHAGTVPMGERHDALAAAAAWTVEVERRVSEEPELVGTVERCRRCREG